MMVCARCEDEMFGGEWDESKRCELMGVMKERRQTREKSHTVHTTYTAHSDSRCHWSVMLSCSCPREVLYIQYVGK